MLTDIHITRDQALLLFAALNSLLLVVTGVSIYEMFQQRRSAAQMLVLVRELTAFNRELLVQLLSANHVARAALERVERDTETT
jgi:hypothetical protein